MRLVEPVSEAAAMGPAGMAPDVRAAFDAIPAPARRTLLELRDLVVATAAEIGGVGAIGETLKWGEPSYAPTRPRIGTPVRLGVTRDDGRPALFVNCQTNLVETFSARYGDVFDFEGNRAIVIRDGRLPRDQLAHCVALALTYYRRKRDVG